MMMMMTSLIPSASFLRRGGGHSRWWIWMLLGFGFLIHECELSMAHGVKTPSASSSASSSSSAFSISSSMFSLVPPDLSDMEHEDDVELSKPLEECRAKNLKQQEKMSMAKLDAHRCLIRDMVVPVPVPDTIIENYIQPSHVVVPRCSGLCLERPGCECVPKKTRYHRVEVVVGTNSSSTSQLCTTIQIPEHRGPCKCKCLIKNCHYNKMFDKEACVCRCKDEFASLKRDCANEVARDANKEWDEETCVCKCKPRSCVDGHYQDRLTCDCKPVETTCSAIGGIRGGAEDAINTSADHHAPSITPAPKYIGLSCVVLVTVAMMLTLYFLMSRRRDRRGAIGLGISAAAAAAGIGNVCGALDADLMYRGNVSSNCNTLASRGTFCDANLGSLSGTLRSSSMSQPHTTTAYTITINSQSASTIDEATIPLTEDKTRF